MNSKLYIIPALLLLVFAGCHSNKKQKKVTEKDYIFFLHNKFLEENPDGTFSDKYKVIVDYKGIINSFKNDGFVVFSEKKKIENQ